jgi:Rrf2 family protein
MKLSTKGRYGLRALTDLVDYGKGSHVSLKTISERQLISENYLETIFSSLKKANIVQSVKGAYGGYMLARPASNITIREILYVLEGDLAIVDPIDTSQLHHDSLSPLLHKVVWDEITQRINDLVNTLSLQDLVDQASDCPIKN